MLGIRRQVLLVERNDGANLSAESRVHFLLSIFGAQVRQILEQLGNRQEKAHADEDIEDDEAHHRQHARKRPRKTQPLLHPANGRPKHGRQEKSDNRRNDDRLAQVEGNHSPKKCKYIQRPARGGVQVEQANHWLASYRCERESCPHSSLKNSRL